MILLQELMGLLEALPLLCRNGHGFRGGEKVFVDGPWIYSRETQVQSWAPPSGASHLNQLSYHLQLRSLEIHLIFLRGVGTHTELKAHIPQWVRRALVGSALCSTQARGSCHPTVGHYLLTGCIATHTGSLGEGCN